MKQIDIVKNTKKVKQELSWHIIAAYLEHIEIFNSLFRDKEFNQLFCALEKYVFDKINVPNDIADTYVIVEHTVDDY